MDFDDIIGTGAAWPWEQLIQNMSSVMQTAKGSYFLDVDE